MKPWSLVACLVFLALAPELAATQQAAVVGANGQVSGVDETGAPLEQVWVPGMLEYLDGNYTQAGMIAQEVYVEQLHSVRQHGEVLQAMGMNWNGKNSSDPLLKTVQKVSTKIDEITLIKRGTKKGSHVHDNLWYPIIMSVAVMVIFFIHEQHQQDGKINERAGPVGATVIILGLLWAQVVSVSYRRMHRNIWRHDDMGSTSFLFLGIMLAMILLMSFEASLSTGPADHREFPMVTTIVFWTLMALVLWTNRHTNEQGHYILQNDKDTLHPGASFSSLIPHQAMVYTAGVSVMMLLTLSWLYWLQRAHFDGIEGFADAVYMAVGSQTTFAFGDISVNTPQAKSLANFANVGPFILTQITVVIMCTFDGYIEIDEYEIDNIEQGNDGLFAVLRLGAPFVLLFLQSLGITNDFATMVLSIISIFFNTRDIGTKLRYGYLGKHRAHDSFVVGISMMAQVISVISMYGAEVNCREFLHNATGITWESVGLDTATLVNASDASANHGGGGGVVRESVLVILSVVPIISTVTGLIALGATIIFLVRFPNVRSASTMETNVGIVICITFHITMILGFAGVYYYYRAQFEDGGTAYIESFGDALYFSCVLHTTLGYGDFPVPTKMMKMVTSCHAWAAFFFLFFTPFCLTPDPLFVENEAERRETRLEAATTWTGEAEDAPSPYLTWIQWYQQHHEITSSIELVACMALWLVQIEGVMLTGHKFEDARIQNHTLASTEKNWHQSTGASGIVFLVNTVLYFRMILRRSKFKAKHWDQFCAVLIFMTYALLYTQLSFVETASENVVFPYKTTATFTVWGVTALFMQLYPKHEQNDDMLAMFMTFISQLLVAIVFGSLYNGFSKARTDLAFFEGTDTWQESFYFSTITHTTIGFGDMSVNYGGRIFLCFHSGIAFMTAILAKIALVGESFTDHHQASNHTGDGVRSKHTRGEQNETEFEAAIEHGSRTDFIFTSLSGAGIWLLQALFLIQIINTDKWDNDPESYEGMFKRLQIKTSLTVKIVLGIACFAVGFYLMRRIARRRVLRNKKNSNDIMVLCWTSISVVGFMLELADLECRQNTTLYKGIPLLSTILVGIVGAYMIDFQYRHAMAQDWAVFGVLAIVAFHFLGLWFFAIVFWLCKHNFQGPNEDNDETPNGTMIDFMDALYFSFISYTTTRFGDFKPVDRMGKALTEAEALFSHILILGGTFMIMPESSMDNHLIGGIDAVEAQERQYAEAIAAAGGPPVATPMVTPHPHEDHGAHHTQIHWYS